MHKKHACRAIRSLYWFKNTTGLAIPFPLWKFALALENTEMNKKQACCGGIRSLYWFRNTSGLAIPFPLWKFALVNRKHRNAQKYREICSLYWLKILLDLLFPFSSENLLLSIEKNRNAQKYKEIRSLYWLKTCYSFSPLKICSCLRKHGNAQNTGKHEEGSGFHLKCASISK